MNDYREVKRGLNRIGTIKVIYWLMLPGMFFIFPIALKRLGDYAYPFVGCYLLVWIAVNNIELLSRCPLCKEKFHAKKDSSWGYFNTFTFSCLNCKVNLDGSNIEECGRRLEEQCKSGEGGPSESSAETKSMRNENKE